MKPLFQRSSLIRRLQEVRELGDVPSWWEGLRRDIINHCELLIGSYQETLAVLDRLSGAVCCQDEDCVL